MLSVDVGAPPQPTAPLRRSAEQGAPALVLGVWRAPARCAGGATPRAPWRRRGLYTIFAFWHVATGAQHVAPGAPRPVPPGGAGGCQPTIPPSPSTQSTSLPDTFSTILGHQWSPVPRLASAATLGLCPRPWRGVLTDHSNCYLPH